MIVNHNNFDTLKLEKKLLRKTLTLSYVLRDFPSDFKAPCIIKYIYAYLDVNCGITDKKQ